MVGNQFQIKIMAGLKQLTLYLIFQEFYFFNFAQNNDRPPPIRFMIENPKANENCLCTKVRDCIPLNELIKQRQFNELKDFERCGFDKKIPKYCCPLPFSLLGRGKFFSISYDFPMKNILSYFLEIVKIAFVGTLVLDIFENPENNLLCYFL